MIQATDFVCPTCKAQVGKSCTNTETVYAYGKAIHKPIHRFGKPHADRRRLARDKRNATKEQKGGVNG